MMSIGPNTYRPVRLKAPKTKSKSTILVKEGKADIVGVINSWTDTSAIDEPLVEEWMKRGDAFWLTAQGTRALHLAEQRQAAAADGVTKPSVLKYAADFYRNVAVEGDDATAEDTMVLVPAASATRSIDVTSRKVTVEEMEAQGRAYRNVSQLMRDRRVLDRADDIAVRVRDEFPLASETWSRWTNKTEKYKETSLTQVMSEYFKDESIGDCGGTGEDYTPLPGYPGTLAPGTQFIENYPLANLSKKILHPWPAMQAYQWHVRQPQAHPMIPPPLLWFALNNMYTDNFTATQLEKAGDTIVGGSNMNPVDAIRIARDSELGRPYDPSVQVDHGGMIFTGGHDIPHYNPDHGPTYEDSAPPVPEELKPITERWFDPLKALAVGIENGLSPLVDNHEWSVSEESEAADELAVRKAASQRLMDQLYPSRTLEKQQRAELEVVVQTALANGQAGEIVPGST